MTSKIQETELREMLRTRLSKQLVHSDDILVDEFCLPDGRSRADVVMVNGVIHAFEIKSDLDSLRRLPSQCANFTPYFDKISLVTTVRHLEKAAGVVPKWWGLQLVERTGDKLALKILRKPKINPTRELEKQLDMLWRSDLLDLAKDTGCSLPGLGTASKRMILTALLERVSPRILRQAVRQKLKIRSLQRLAQR